jgi:hypothetical protein
MTIILDSRFVELERGADQRRGAAVNSRTDKTGNEVRGMNGRGICRKVSSHSLVIHSPDCLTFHPVFRA